MSSGLAPRLRDGAVVLDVPARRPRGGRRRCRSCRRRRSRRARACLRPGPRSAEGGWPWTYHSPSRRAEDGDVGRAVAVVVAGHRDVVRPGPRSAGMTAVALTYQIAAPRGEDGDVGRRRRRRSRRAPRCRRRCPQICGKGGWSLTYQSPLGRAGRRRCRCRRRRRSRPPAAAEIHRTRTRRRRSSRSRRGRRRRRTRRRCGFRPGRRWASR